MSPDNRDTPALNGTSQGTEPKSLDSPFRLSVSSLGRPLGNSALCGAKGIPHDSLQLDRARDADLRNPKRTGNLRLGGMTTHHELGNEAMHAGALS